MNRLNRFRIIQISDSHFGTVLPGVAEGLIATIQNLSPNLILFTGDITQRAKKSEFVQAHQFVEALKPVPLIAVPGNHDIPLFNIIERMMSPYRNFRTLFKGDVEKDFDNGDIYVIGLNSTSRWRHIQGALNPKRLRERLAQARGPHKVRIAVFHHPMDCGRAQDDKNLLRDRNEIIEILTEGKIDLVLGGHIHDPFITTSLRRYPSLGRSLLIGVAGTCTSWRTRSDAPNSFNLIDMNLSESLSLQFDRYDQQADQRFALKSSSHFTRRADGWSA